MMLGCHETRAELGLGTGKRGFAGGTFDEVRSFFGGNILIFEVGLFGGIFFFEVRSFFGKYSLFCNLLPGCFLGSTNWGR